MLKRVQFSLDKKNVPGEMTHEMPFTANSVTNIPPPPAANAGPYVAPGFVTVHPSLLLTAVEQSVVLTNVLVCTDVFDCTQP